MQEQVETRAEYIDTAEQAKLIRAALKRAFPAVKFSVRIDRYAGGSSVNISWTDGPTESQVEEISSDYQGGGFDGMIDLAYSRQAWLLPDGSVRFAHTGGTEGSRGTIPEAHGSPMHPDAKLVQFLGHYVFANRRISPEFLERCLDKVREASGLPVELEDKLPDFWYRGKSYPYPNPSAHECAQFVARRTATKPSEWVPDYMKPKPRKPKGSTPPRPVMIYMRPTIEHAGREYLTGHVFSTKVVKGFTYEPDSGRVSFYGGKGVAPKYLREAVAAVLSWATGQAINA